MTEEKHKILNNDRSSSSWNLNPEFPANEAQLLHTTGKFYASYFTSESVSTLKSEALHDSDDGVW